MGMANKPNYFVEVFRCCEDCKMSESCINVGYGCCSYKLYEKKDDTCDSENDYSNKYYT